jgi:plasmid stability protein
MVATLNIKSFPDKLYSKLQKRAKVDRRSLAQEIIHILDMAISEPAQLSILEMQGVGKEIWQGIDAAEYVKQERQAWD